jgi:uncharacterized protein
MVQAAREFQIFAKPAGPACNLACSYCYYLDKAGLYPASKSRPMAEDVLEEYIRQHLAAAPGPDILFSWHGGEPTLLGLDYFRKIRSLQKKHQRAGQKIKNGLQTNGTLLDEDWGRFLAEERFAVGLSLDGPADLHNRYRLTKTGHPTHDRVMGAYELLRRRGIHCDLLCVVHGDNVRYPVEVYDFFKSIGVRHLTFLPLVEKLPGAWGQVSPRTVPAEAWGKFLCTIYDLWKASDIGRIGLHIFEQTAQTAFGREQSLCLFRQTCGDIPVIEHNGDFYACDHYVDPDHRLGNIMETPLVELLESPGQRAFGRRKLDTLPRYCRECEVLEMCHGECPKNRFIDTPDGEPGLNYLCTGYKRFFNHCRPFVAELAALWQQTAPDQTSASDQTTPRGSPKIGRNDPCPCGSGRKYKKCCLGK